MDYQKFQTIATLSRALFGKLDDKHIEILGVFVRGPLDGGLTPYEAWQGTALPQRTSYRRTEELLRDGYLAIYASKPFTQNPKREYSREVNLTVKGLFAALGSLQNTAPLQLDQILARFDDLKSQLFPTLGFSFEDLLQGLLQYLYDKRVDLSSLKESDFVEQLHLYVSVFLVQEHPQWFPASIKDEQGKALLNSMRKATKFLRNPPSARL